MKIFEIRTIRHNMRKKPGSLFFFIVFFSAFICLSLVRHSTRHHETRGISKRDTGEPVPPDDKPELPPPDEPESAPHDDPGFEPLPGTLICEQKVAPRDVSGTVRPVPVAPRVLPAVLSVDTVKKLPLVNGWNQVGQKKGCCPAGSRTGTVYLHGFSCCVDKVFNASEKFCCLEKNRVLDITQDNVEYCYPLNQPHFCRTSDLQVAPQQTLVCEYANKEKTPTTCEFQCPKGSQVRGTKAATCTTVGTWNIQPQCCEGCPPSTKKDIWFIADVDSGVGIGGLSDVQSFIKGLISYLPVSAESVRVALTAFSRSVFTDISWTLSDYSNHEELNAAINLVTSDDLGRNTGAALQWVANNAFTEENGDRTDVDNVIVLVTTGNPDDEFGQAADMLREKGQLVIIAVGPDPTSEELATNPSSESDFLRVLRFADLDQFRKSLYTNLCGENCLT